MSDSLEKFQKLLKSTDKPIIVMFSATWCTPCRLIKPIFLNASKNHSKAVFVIVDMDEGVDIGSEYNIRTIPIVKVFVNGEEKDNMKGSNEDALKTLLAKYI